MNFSAYLAESMETGEIMRALEEIEGAWQNGESMGFDEDESSSTFGSYLYRAQTSDSLDSVIDLFTDMLGYEVVEQDSDTVAFYRMDTVVQLMKTGSNEYTFAIDHAPSDEPYDLDEE